MKKMIQKIQQNPLLKNLLLLTFLIIMCSLLVRVLLSGETLTEYADASSEEAISQNDADSAVAQSTTTQQDASTASPVMRNDSAIASSTQQDSASAASSKQNSTSTASTQQDSASESESDLRAVESQRVLYQDGFYYEPLSSVLISKITGSSFPSDTKDCKITYQELRYVHVLYTNFEGTTSEGDLICNQTIAQDLVEIFYTLYENQYPIERISLIDSYHADDELSMEADNTSCFNYRVIAGSDKVSKHGYGLAVDLNPLYNPEVSTDSNDNTVIAPTTATSYSDRTADFPHKISNTDLAYQQFIAHGFTWGGDWHSKKDYQHFEHK